jgi:hypothetical protein
MKEEEIKSDHIKSHAQTAQSRNHSPNEYSQSLLKI